MGSYWMKQVPGAVSLQPQLAKSSVLPVHHEMKALLCHVSFGHHIPSKHNTKQPLTDPKLTTTF